ncbi:MAG: hypothetical protein M1834_004467 [Cirrosporium novae-zelandiae]|nr:MAG: hypothetical protein M1834_004467 [Cirrosporium novae-zelandiae]
MAAARLRRTFRYPEDDSTGDERDELDEEEQEAIIENLRLEDEGRNKLYTTIFAALPLILTTTFLPALFGSSPSLIKLISLLGITSLGATAYTLIFIPIPKPDPKGKRPLYRAVQEEGPLQKYLELLNGALCALLSIAAWRIKDKQGAHEGFWMICLVPAVMFVLITIARRVMHTVNIDELERLRYEYKGA